MCVGKAWAGGSSNTCVENATVLTFVAIAVQWDKTQWRRVAVVALPNGKLTWAELLGKNEGLLNKVEASPRVPNEQLSQLQAQPG